MHVQTLISTVTEWMKLDITDDKQKLGDQTAHRLCKLNYASLLYHHENIPI